MVQDLDDMCFKVFKEQFWESDWKTTTLSATAPDNIDDFRKGIFAGMNAIPSQFQVHLQYIVPPFHPLDYHAFLHGKRFVKNRWLPLEYVLGSLAALEKAGVAMTDAHTMEHEDCFAKVKELGGPAYEVAYPEAIRRYNDTYVKCANWSPENYDCVVVTRNPGPVRPELLGHYVSTAPPPFDEACASCDGTGKKGEEDCSQCAGSGKAGDIVVKGLRTGAADPDKTVVGLEKSDKEKLQSFGRPYVVDDKGVAKGVANSYYQYPRQPGEVQSADAFAAASP